MSGMTAVRREHIFTAAEVEAMGGKQAINAFRLHLLGQQAEDDRRGDTP